MIWILASSFVVLSLLAYLILFFVGDQHIPTNFWLIPMFYLLLTLVLGLITKKYSSVKKELSIGIILGIRVFFISLIAVFIILTMLIDRVHILPLTIIFVIFTLVFSTFETKILLILNKKKY